MKKPNITEETNYYIEVEVPKGKSEEYDLNDYIYCGNGQDFCNPPNFYEYYYKLKQKVRKNESNKNK